MKKKNRKLRAALCVFTALLILGTAVFANYDNAGGYSEIKNALKNMLYQDNFSLNATAGVSIDGANAGFSEKVIYKLNGGGKVQSYEYTEETVDYELDYSHESICQDGDRYSSTTTVDDEGNRHTSAYVYSGYGDAFPIADLEDERISKGVNLAEALSDVLVGDIKNNIALTQSDESGRTYTLNMSGEQLPKYLTAAFAFLCAGIREEKSGNLHINSEYEKTVIDIMTNAKEPYVKNVCGNVTIDDRDRITAFDGTVSIIGYDGNNNARELSYNLSLTVGDFGTTFIDPVTNPEDYNSMATAGSDFK